MTISGATISEYIDLQASEYKEICEQLRDIISNNLPRATNKIWHAHPVWFLDGNPIVGFSVQKPGVRLMFWSGADFDESDLQPGSGKFKDASIVYTDVQQINNKDVARWLQKSQTIQWDYKNLVKNKGLLKNKIRSN
ncbi:DUF1801 domain-containing protein [Candidatus Saccharibacteria bacterium]|nr:DUF1801 domain-containing protein [Candidatus Saccharibacteria bacterium]